MVKTATFKKRTRLRKKAIKNNGLTFQLRFDLNEKMKKINEEIASERFYESRGYC